MQSPGRVTSRDPRLELCGVLGGVALRATGQPSLHRGLQLQAGPVHSQLCLQGQDDLFTFEGLKSTVLLHCIDGNAYIKDINSTRKSIDDENTLCTTTSMKRNIILIWL